MKIVIAPDKFKGSLTALEFCAVVANAIYELHPEATIVNLPLADGGDGTIEVVNFYLKGAFVKAKVNNPLFKEITATYLYNETSQTAFIEMAEASGLKLLQPSEFDCKNTSTIGTGELILDALDKGAKEIILGIGGSATNDCGIGMATALGYRFLDVNKKEVKPVGANLSKIVSIDVSKVNSKLKHVNVRIACDVTNPLYGKNGAAHIYAKQKGASSKDIELLDKGLRDFSKVLDHHFKMDTQHISGAGAAGGMGIGTMLFLKGNLISGVALIKELAQFDDKIKNADWIITGEGQLDDQTLSGKTIKGVIDSANRLNIPVAALCGSVTISVEMQKKLDLTYVASIMRNVSSLEEAIENAHDNLYHSAYNLAKTWKV